MSIHGDHPQAPAARVYISGPISGRLDRNRPLFERMAQVVEDAGHIAVNPQKVDHEHAGRCSGGDNIRHPGDTSPPDRHQYGCYMRADLKALLDCDMILMLPNWLDSRGARMELRVAEIIGMEIINPGDDIAGRLRRWREREIFRNVKSFRADILRTEVSVPLPSRNPLEATQDCTAKEYDL